MARALVAAAIGWPVLLGAALSCAWTATAVSRIRSSIFVASRLCHQLPARSFFTAGIAVAGLWPLHGTLSGRALRRAGRRDAETDAGSRLGSCARRSRAWPRFRRCSRSRSSGRIWRPSRVSGARSRGAAARRRAAPSRSSARRRRRPPSNRVNWRGMPSSSKPGAAPRRAGDADSASRTSARHGGARAGSFPAPDISSKARSPRPPCSLSCSPACSSSGLAFGGRLFPFQLERSTGLHGRRRRMDDWGAARDRRRSAVSGRAMSSRRPMSTATRFLITAGLLNMLTALDAFDVAAGRKAK